MYLFEVPIYLGVQQLNFVREFFCEFCEIQEKTDAFFKNITFIHTKLVYVYLMNPT